jgi:hypothetical protein
MTLITLMTTGTRSTADRSSTRVRWDGVSRGRGVVVRPVVVAALLAATFALGGCGPQPDPPSGPGTPMSSVTPSGPVSGPSPDQEAEMRTRLADGLRAASPTVAKLVEDPTTELTPQEITWLTGWQVVDIVGTVGLHPQRYIAALAEDGTAVRLTDNPQAFTTMVGAAGVEVGSAKLAGRVGTDYLDLTRSFARSYSYRIASLADVKWRTKNVTSAQQAARAKVEQEAAVAAPDPRRDGQSWTMHVWTVTGQALVDHALTVGHDGSVTDSPTTAAENLPVQLVL